jgi:hypothetical protein
MREATHAPRLGWKSDRHVFADTGSREISDRRMPATSKLMRIRESGLPVAR